MLVKDLIEILNQLDPNLVVVLSRDPEGNGFAALEDYTEGFFNTSTEEFWSEEEFFDNDGEEEVDDYLEDENSEYYVKPHGLPSIVFWPRT